jgi:hypothetical protein
MFYAGVYPCATPPPDRVSVVTQGARQQSSVGDQSRCTRLQPSDIAARPVCRRPQWARGETHVTAAKQLDITAAW